MVFLIEMFGVSLAVTLAAELFAALAAGYHSVKCIGLVVLANVLTNPAAVLLHWLGMQYLPDMPKLAWQLVIEAAVIFTEASVYRSFAKQPQWDMKRPVAFAILSNLLSWFLGMMI